MNSDSGPDGPDNVPDDEDVPIYEPMYPEYEYNCSHPDCDEDSPQGKRLCHDCSPIMLTHIADTCDYCGQEI